MSTEIISLPEKLEWPLMKNNITTQDINELINFLKHDEPILTQSIKVKEFEKEWSNWLGTKYSVFVNSGSSANILTMAALRNMYGPGEVIVPPLTWVSDIASVLHACLQPVFADITLSSLGMDTERIIEKITPQTKAVFLTHILGYNALTEKLQDELAGRHIPLIEDVCESHGANFNGKKLGTFGMISNFSFYYAHHMSTIEGGMICTNDQEVYESIRMMRAHGMVREAESPHIKKKYLDMHPDLNPDFIFGYPAYNMRSTEINAVLGLSQLKRLDSNNAIRRENLEIFLKNLDSKRYNTDFNMEGNSNYAFTLLLREPDKFFCEKVMTMLRESGVEFRRGMSGGGNQLRQPYLRGIVPDNEYKKYPNVEHVHFYGFYIGNYPTLEKEKIISLCRILNNI